MNINRQIGFGHPSGASAWKSVNRNGTVAPILDEPSGDINGLMQHSLAVYFDKSSKLITFASANSNGILPRLGSD